LILLLFPAGVDNCYWPFLGMVVVVVAGDDCPGEE
jgi:hypothetical protein